MSQIFKPLSATPPPPGFVETLTGDTGGPIGPDASDNINIIGNAANVTLSNGYVVSGSGHTLQINDTEGTGTTVGAQSVNLVVLTLGSTPGVYTFVARFSAFDTTDVGGGCYQVVTGAITDGASATIVGLGTSPVNGPVIDCVLDSGLSSDLVSVIAVGNQVAFQGNGTIALKTIHWKCSVNWTFVS